MYVLLWKDIQYSLTLVRWDRLLFLVSVVCRKIHLSYWVCSFRCLKIVKSRMTMYRIYTHCSLPTSWSNTLPPVLKCSFWFNVSLTHVSVILLAWYMRQTLTHAKLLFFECIVPGYTYVSTWTIEMTSRGQTYKIPRFSPNMDISICAKLFPITQI